MNAIVVCCVDHQRAPTATDVEQPVARLQLQLLADQIKLARLRLIKRVFRRTEVSARVDHRFAEHAAVELVRNVVVVRDRLLIALGAVEAALQLDLSFRRRWLAAAQQAELACGLECRNSVGRLQRRVAPLFGQVERQFKIAVNLKFS